VVVVGATGTVVAATVGAGGSVVAGSAELGVEALFDPEHAASRITAAAAARRHRAIKDRMFGRTYCQVAPVRSR